MVAAMWAAVFALSWIPTFLIVAIVILQLDRMATRRAEKRGGTLPPEERLMFFAAILLVEWLTGIHKLFMNAIICSVISVSIHASLREPEEAELPPPVVSGS